MIKLSSDSGPAPEPSKPKIPDTKLLSIVNYTINLILAKEELANDWERSFVSSLYLFLLQCNRMTEKQDHIFIKIKDWIEKELGVSLNV
jgi:hypothetical protein